MGNKLYVGNLAYSVNDAQLKELFSEFGAVESANVIVDKMTDRSKGFGFVEMSSEAEAHSAMEAMNGKDVDGRQIVVNEARPMQPRD